MTFINLLMLGGAFAASIPLLIHLLNRSKYQVVQWGAMHLLEAVIEENQRRIQFLEWLLLLVRCLIPVILALCMARPILSSAAVGLYSFGDLATIIILDDSLSMSRKNGDEKTRFERALESVDVIRSASKSSLEPIVISNSVPALSQPIAGNFDLLNSLDRAIQIAAGDVDHTYEIVILSDFQQSSLKGLTESTSVDLRARLAGLQKPPTVCFLPIAPEQASDAIMNARLATIDIEPNLWTPGNPVQVTGLVANDGTVPIAELRVELLVDNVVEEAKLLSLSPGDSREIEFDYDAQREQNLLEPDGAAILRNDHLVTLRLTSNDDCDRDNIVHSVARSANAIRVAIIDQFESVGSEQGENRTSKFLQVALSPFSYAGVHNAASDLIVSTAINGAADREIEFDNFDVVVLNDPVVVESDFIEGLCSFVRGGGALLVFAGPRLVENIDWFNENLLSEKGLALGTQLRPSEIGNLQKPQTVNIADQRFDHPATMFFNSPANGDIGDAVFTKWLSLSSVDARTKRVASLTNGDPLVAEYYVDEGTVVLYLSSSDTTWNNLPLRPEYLPFMQRLVEYLAFGKYPPPTAKAGVPANVFVMLDNENTATTAVAQISTPDGREYRVDSRSIESFANVATVEVANTHASGAYEIRVDNSEPYWYVALADDDEWTSRINRDIELQQTAAQLGAEVSPSAVDYVNSRVKRIVGTEIWNLIWVGVLCLLVLERVIVLLLARMS